MPVGVGINGFRGHVGARDNAFVVDGYACRRADLTAFVGQRLPWSAKAEPVGARA